MERVAEEKQQEVAQASKSVEQHASTMKRVRYNPLSMSVTSLQ